MGFYVNYIAVLVAAAASMVIGMLWYGPLFGKQWLKLMSWDKKQIKKAKSKGMTQLMIIGFIATLITAYVLAIFVGKTDLIGGASIAFYAWIGFVAPIMLGMVLWENRPFQLYVINATYQLVSLIVMGIIIVSF